MTAKIRRVDFYPDEFLIGVVGLSAEEIGAFWVTCALIYSTGAPVAADDPRILRCGGIGPRRWPAIRQRLIAAGKLRLDDTGHLTNHRCLKALDDARHRVEQAAANGRSGGRPPKHHDANFAGTPVEVAVERPLDDHLNPSSTMFPESFTMHVSQENNELAKPGGFSGEKLTTTITTNQQTITLDHDASSKLDDDFEHWYAKYPRHVGRGQAARAYRAARRKADGGTLLDAVTTFAAATAATDPKYIPHPATWLNAQRWLDETPAGQPAPKPRPQAADWDFSGYA